MRPCIVGTHAVCRGGLRTIRRTFHCMNAPVVDARWPGWEVVIGVEVHAQIKSREKLFSNSVASDHAAALNANVSPFDAAFPGTLPRLNAKCVELGVRTGIALGSDVQPRSTFDRKHYFYSDLPTGYQITQNYAPLAKGGHLRLDKHGQQVRIKQIQLEQDTGKTTYNARTQKSAIDLNRAGVGLMEIVSDPDMRSPEQAGDYIRTLQRVLRSVGSSDGNMEDGSLRCDVNVSVNKKDLMLGTRCEIKNLNSVKGAQVAIASEIFRQIEILESGGTVQQETRGFDEDRAETFSLRSKEDAPDYRYMPDPNLPPILLTPAYVERIRETMPELPDATRSRLAGLRLSAQVIDVLMSVDAGREVGFDGQLGAGAVAYFDTVAATREPRVVANWLTNELLGQLSFREISFKENPISPTQLGELIDLLARKTITGTAAKTLLRHMLDNPSTSGTLDIAKQLSLLATSSEDSGEELRKWCQEAIQALPEESQGVRDGNLKVLNKILGRVMKLSDGRADAQKAKKTLTDLLSLTMP